MMNESETSKRGVRDGTPVHLAHLWLVGFVVRLNHVHGVIFIASGGRGTASPLPVLLLRVMPLPGAPAQPQVVGATALPRPPVAPASRDDTDPMLGMASQHGPIRPEAAPAAPAASAQP
ncbi:MAG: hypothetical protein Q8R28_18920 [Dehalococcoidia bacterium]|nr:hypothetical protein [Dehalococcoidia bacterium]